VLGRSRRIAGLLFHGQSLCGDLSYFKRNSQEVSNKEQIIRPVMQFGGTRWRIWLRHCATNRKVAGSVPDCFIGIFYWPNPSGRTMALGLIQPVTEMSTRIFPGGKVGQYVGLTNLPHS